MQGVCGPWKFMYVREGKGEGMTTTPRYITVSSPTGFFINFWGGYVLTKPTFFSF